MNKNLTWEEELAVSTREVSIDFDIFRRAMKLTVDNLQESFNKHKINQKISSNLKDNITIGDLKDINIILKENGEVVIKSSLEFECIFARIKPYKGYFIIEYINSKREPSYTYFLDEQIINEVIGDIVFQVKED